MTPLPKLLFLAGLVIAAALVAGCTTSGDRPPSTAEPTTTVPLQLNESADGTTHAVALNSIINLTLNENPTTNYSWKVSITPGLRIISDDYVSDDPSGTVVGAGGTHHWQIAAHSLGHQRIRGVYAQPWENSVQNVTDFKVDLSVTP